MASTHAKEAIKQIPRIEFPENCLCGSWGDFYQAAKLLDTVGKIKAADAAFIFYGETLMGRVLGRGLVF